MWRLQILKSFFKKGDFALRKCKLDFLLLEACLENHLITKLVNSGASNLHFKTSSAYCACQLKLVRE